jgi:nucleoside-diphosphate-sugar epimerase
VLVFSSSVSTYGDTTAESRPIRVDHPQTALDLYAESKIAGEQLLRQSALGTVVLRIAGIAVPELQEPPAVWPFTAVQRLEMVHRDDVVTACTRRCYPAARGKILNVAGGSTHHCAAGRRSAQVRVPLEMVFSSRHQPGWVGQ